LIKKDFILGRASEHLIANFGPYSMIIEMQAKVVRRGRLQRFGKNIKKRRNTLGNIDNAMSLPPGV